ncbi:MAG TPA: DUF4199 domain-containing protein [Candidatus Synoicihabitans sp.]|nr:DUF4199 domain-containing protein [Candidatus Synoicihabitans sp.]
MKTTLVYGAGIAIGGAILTLVFYLLGYHTDVEKFQTGQRAGMLWYLILIIGLVLGLRAVRESSPDRSLSYGRGVGSGALISLWTGIFSAVFTIIYAKLINPRFGDTMLAFQEAQMTEKGMTAEQIEQAAGFMRLFSNPVIVAVASILGTLVIGTVFAVVIALFVKRAPAPNAAPV